MSRTIRIGVGFAVALLISAFSGNAKAQVGFGVPSTGIGNGLVGQTTYGYGGYGFNNGFGGGFNQGYAAGGFVGNQPMFTMQQRQTVNNIGGLSSLIQRQAFRRSSYGVSSYGRGRR